MFEWIAWTSRVTARTSVGLGWSDATASVMRPTVSSGCQSGRKTKRGASVANAHVLGIADDADDLIAVRSSESERLADRRAPAEVGPGSGLVHDGDLDGAAGVARRERAARPAAAMPNVRK